MSLIRLLATTRSLSDVKNEPSPYRMTEQGLLPKFGPRKPREAGGAPPDLGGHKGPVNEGKENLGEGHGDRMDAGCSLKPESSRRPKGLAGWWQRWFGRRSRREPVQTEFALDLVRVVRNELREAEAMVAEQKKSKLKLEQPPDETMKHDGAAKFEDRPTEESVFGASRG